MEDECTPEVLCTQCAAHRRTKGEEVIWAETPADWEELICVDCGFANEQYHIHQCEMDEYLKQKGNNDETILDN